MALMMALEALVGLMLPLVLMALVALVELMMRALAPALMATTTAAFSGDVGRKLIGKFLSDDFRG